MNYKSHQTILSIKLCLFCEGCTTSWNNVYWIVPLAQIIYPQYWLKVAPLWSFPNYIWIRQTMRYFNLEIRVTNRIVMNTTMESDVIHGRSVWPWCSKRTETNTPFHYKDRTFGYRHPHGKDKMAWNQKKSAETKNTFCIQSFSESLA